MTFSIVGHCERTGMFGVAITTSSICVGARCPHARAGVGAVANVLASGAGAKQALETVLQGRDHLDYRQLTVVDQHGETASFTGSNILGTNAESNGAHCYAAGNLLSTIEVPLAMTQGFEKNADCHLAERLLKALEAGLAAGGEEGDVHSAALVVVDTMPFPLVDLRVDWDDENPVLKLRKLWQDYQPQMIDYLTRAIDPSDAPSYGVPGDE